MLLVFAQMPSPRYGIPCLIIGGIMQSFCMVSLQIMLLRESGERFRGRVMGVRMMAIYSLPLGLLAAGPLIDWIGFRAHGVALRDRRHRLHADHRAALARGAVAGVSARASGRAAQDLLFVLRHRQRLHAARRTCR